MLRVKNSALFYELRKHFSLGKRTYCSDSMGIFLNVADLLTVVYLRTTTVSSSLDFYTTNVCNILDRHVSELVLQRLSYFSKRTHFFYDMKLPESYLYFPKFQS